MQREVLNRSVCCDGVTFEAGTPIGKIPKDNRESCQRSGWTRFEEVEVASGKVPPTPQPKARAEPVVGADDVKADVAEADEAKADDAKIVDVTNDVAKADDVKADEAKADEDPELLVNSKLEVRVIDLLKANTPPIVTKADARQWLAANKTFRTIEGIGKASDAAIRLVLDPEPASA